LANVSVSNFWNIGIDGQFNIGNQPNIGENFLKISVYSNFKKWFCRNAE